MAGADRNTDGSVLCGPAKVFAFEREEHGALLDSEVLGLVPVPVVRGTGKVLGVFVAATVGWVDFFDDEDALAVAGVFPMDVAGAALEGQPRQVAAGGTLSKAHFGEV